MTGSTVAFGASTTWGWGAGSGGYSAAEGGYEGDSYPRQLAAMTGWDVDNQGIAGDKLTAGSAHDTYTNALFRFEAYVAANPGQRAIVVWIGINDITSGQAPSLLKTGYTRMITAAAAAGTPLFLMTLQPVGLAAGSAYELAREDVNNWIRAGHGAYVIDVEPKLAGSSLNVMNNVYIANGHSANPQTGYPHLSVVGYAVVAQAVTTGTNSPVTSVPLVTY
jgi:lysophospholipase L1-like esterase